LKGLLNLVEAKSFLEHRAGAKATSAKKIFSRKLFCFQKGFGEKEV